MFTVETIKAAHSKVKSGADFPAYIAELKQLGVVSYETYVADGHTDFYGKAESISGSHSDNYRQPTHLSVAAEKHNDRIIAGSANTEQFKIDLKLHQQGKTDYPTFCQDCAKSGVNKWNVQLDNMTCTYYDKAGNELLVENIPA